MLHVHFLSLASVFATLFGPPPFSKRCSAKFFICLVLLADFADSTYAIDGHTSVLARNLILKAHGQYNEIRIQRAESSPDTICIELALLVYWPCRLIHVRS